MQRARRFSLCDFSSCQIQVIVFSIGPSREVLTQHPPPPAGVTQTQAEGFQLSRRPPDGIQFEFIWYFRIPDGILPHRINPPPRSPPPASHLGIITLRIKRDLNRQRRQYRQSDFVFSGTRCPHGRVCECGDQKPVAGTSFKVAYSG